MTRQTHRTFAEIADSASELATGAAQRIGGLFGTTPDGFTDKLVARAKAIEPRDYVPSRASVARTGTSAGLVLAGSAAIAAGAFAIYYWRERNQEEAKYDLMAQEADFELRRYRPQLVAETVQRGGRSEALALGFRRLADYIFAKPGGRTEGADDEKIAMTLPVSVSAKDNRHWITRFVMPSSLDRADLLEPASGVTIAKRAKRHVAALRFSGKSDDEDLVEAKRRELAAWVAERGFKPVDKPEYAFYNAPVVPGFLRRNEVWIAIEAP